MRVVRRAALTVAGIAAATFAFASSRATAQGAAPSVTTLNTGAFEFSDTLIVRGSPEAVFDAMTGNIAGWWDHSFSEHPKFLYIEPKPGGGFYEIFDDAGNGVRHATVTYADRGKRLTFEGALGLSGHPVVLVNTLSYEKLGADSTRIVLVVRGEGEMQPSWPQNVAATWRHFLHERFGPYWIKLEHDL